MPSNDSNPVFGDHARVTFTVREDSGNVSISRPLSSEDMERMRRQFAEWQARGKRQQAS